MLRWRQGRACGFFHTAARERPPCEVETPTVVPVDPPPFIRPRKLSELGGTESRRHEHLFSGVFLLSNTAVNLGTVLATINISI